ncbi:MAG: class I SAM-dependent RNA methyltransferase [Nitrospirae bacterium]|nr:class I SAM-dependent RNA methyltransferase [Nitrospirota bacterium]
MPHIRKNNVAGKSRILITCAKGIPPYLREEVLALGFPVLDETIAGIATEGTIDDTLRLNLLLRTAHRVLFLIREFAAPDADALYRAASEIPWEEYIAPDGYVCVTSSVDNPTIRDSRFANVRCKDAIVDRIKDKCGRRPDSGPDQDRAVVNLYWKNSRCSLYIDTSGEPLSRRGYRKIPLTAPMQETLAAAVILATGWAPGQNGSGHFINPMCGSGTLAIEAALIGLNRAPGLLRDNFGFMHIRGFNEAVWDELRAQAKKTAKKALDCRIIATDIRTEAVEAAKKNAATAGVGHLIEFAVCDYSETPVPDSGGIVILNPEYGERMGKIKELESVYKGIGDFFKQKCRGYNGYLFTGNLDLAKKVGLRAKRRIQFFNSRIECRLLEYELYVGSRKNKNAEIPYG